MPKFNDSENISNVLLPEGDYKFCVTEFECSLSKGGKTNGSDKFEMTLEIEGKDCRVFENLIDHPACDWKIDTFLKSAGVKLSKGESFEFRKDIAESKSVKWVNPLGLRGWCRLSVEKYTRKNGEPGETNRVSVFYTDKEKLAPRVIEIEEEDIPFA